jgi:hypothetical protein
MTTNFAEPVLWRMTMVCWPSIRTVAVASSLRHSALVLKRINANTMRQSQKRWKASDYAEYGVQDGKTLPRPKPENANGRT